MKIGIIYNAPCDMLSVFQQPMDNAANAVSNLAIQLTKIGHNVTLFTQAANNPGALDVRCRNISIKSQALYLDPAIQEPDFQALIIKNDSPEFAARLKHVLPAKPKVYLWTAFDAQLAVNNSLANPEIINQLSGIICVSEWQRKRFLDKFAIKNDLISVGEYAISPVFEDLFVDGKELKAIKSKPPLIAYIGRPQAGLEILLNVFPDVANNYQDACLNIFSNLHITGAEQSKYENIYNAAINTKGIKCIESISKIQLAVHLRKHTILAFPGTIAETSHVDILEALAAGVYVVTSNVGSIPNYCDGHAKTVPPELLQSDSLDSFVSELLTITQTQVHSDAAFFDYCFKQAVEINKRHTWRIRARTWEALLARG